MLRSEVYYNIFERLASLQPNQHNNNINHYSRQRLALLIAVLIHAFDTGTSNIVAIVTAQR